MTNPPRRAFFSSSPLLFIPFVAFSCLLGACDSSASSEQAAAAAEDTESSEAAISSACAGVSAKDFAHYPLNGANVGRELEESLSASFVQVGGVSSGSAKVPGVLRARHSTSVYDFAAALDLRGWSHVGTGNFDGIGSDLFVRISGSSTDPDKRTFKASKALFDALTRATETTGNGATRRSSAHGSVTCERYSDGASYQCALGPVHTVTPLEGACP